VVLIAMLEPGGDVVDAPMLERASAAILDVLRAAGGDAEPLATDRIVGAFDTPTGAVEAGFRARARVVGDAGPSGMGIRIGVHAADIVTSCEGAALGEAIAAATRLAARAPADALCVPLVIARTVERTLGLAVQDLGAPPAGEPHAYLVLAPEPRTRWARRRVIGGLAAAAVLAAAVGLTVLGRRPVPSTGVTLGVMPFKGAGVEAEDAGLRAALRDGLNTQLSVLEGVKVYSREFLDFLVTREGLTEFEAATRLGIRKMLSASVTSKGADVRVEVQVVDVGTGTLDNSFVVVGSEHALIDLESDIARAVILRLGLSLSRADERRLESFRATDVDAYRRFLATEGEGAPDVPARASPPRPDEGPSSWLLPRAAWADEASARADVMAFLERYRKAIEARDLDTLAGLYVEFPAEQRTALARYFGDATDLRVKLEDVDVAVAGDEAMVSYTRIDDFVDAPTGRPIHVSGRMTKLLRRTDGRWQLATGR
jgi:ketosteroid isomerase-like protein/TolB-like protein